ncbi:MAG: DEAD/DEAH box helicase family protein, partial [Spirochaetaceae bacterium]|nr:DEAD/DEAH box helicase family protein [Spirochaetaceae bacterium]
MAGAAYGLTPWGALFIGALGRYDVNERLNRGRRYANAGHVVEANFAATTVNARVKGSYRPFYQVTITFPELGASQKAEVERIVEENPALLARIAAGELPEELLTLFEERGVSLMPKRWSDMKRVCTCPDSGDPCKHMAAVYYIIAREIDADPHTLFRLRGINNLAASGGVCCSPEESALPGINVQRRIGDGAANEITPPLGLAKTLSPSPAPEVPGGMANCVGLITSLLPRSPVFCARDFAVTLAEFYHQAVRNVHWRMAGDDPAREHRFSRSTWGLHGTSSAHSVDALLLTRQGIDGRTERLSPYDAFVFFREFAGDEGSPSYRYLFYLFKFLNVLCAACAFIPAPSVEKGTLKIIWKPFDSSAEIRAALDGVASLRPQGMSVPPASGKTPVDDTELLCAAALGGWVRAAGFAAQGGDALFRELCSLFFAGAAVDVSSPATRSLPVAIDRWLLALRTDFCAWKYRITLKAGGREKKAGEGITFSLSMDMALGRHDGAEAGSAGGKREVRWIPLKDAAKAAGTIEALRAATALSNYLPELRILMVKKSVPLTEKRLVMFLDEATGILSRLGIVVAFPKALHRELKPHLVIQGEAKKAGSLVSYLDMDSLLDWKWQVAIGGTALTADEFRALVRQKSAVVRFRDRFIRLDPAETAALLRQAERAPRPALQEVLQAYFSGDMLLSVNAEELVGKLFEERQFSKPAGLHADLRAYQERGVNWICSLLYAGFGCILADDMGLGKTVQAIAALLRLSEDHALPDKTLVIAPAALLENWERELARFAPSAAVGRYHGPRRRLDQDDDVYLTTYQTAVRDAAKLSERAFSLLIVDEAHLMKNAETRGAKTVKQLRAAYRLALSGTPVENRLEDLRSLFEFALPGYLGTAADFKQNYRIPVEVMRDKAAAERLKKITAPFLLRRLKTDRAIIQDLPEKIVTNHYAALEKEQAALYESIVRETLKKSKSIEDPA